MDPSTDEAYTLRKLIVKLEGADTHFWDRLKLVPGPHYDEHMSAVESVVSTNLEASPPKVNKVDDVWRECRTTPQTVEV